MNTGVGRFLNFCFTNVQNLYIYLRGFYKHKHENYRNTIPYFTVKTVSMQRDSVDKSMGVSITAITVN